MEAVIIIGAIIELLVIIAVFLMLGEVRRIRRYLEEGTTLAQREEGDKQARQERLAELRDQRHKPRQRE